METTGTPEFAVDYVTVGPYANGFGHFAGSRSFAFRVVRRDLIVELYRDGLASAVPTDEDVVARAHTPITDIDLDDERSLVATVRDLVSHAAPVVESADRGFLGRISSVIG
ncbi:MAG: hypothetical protein LLG14_22915 [Nocardiaceae bacterium]|nr:hypothetical protein [Nocardiaceae bacterium]